MRQRGAVVVVVTLAVTLLTLIVASDPTGDGSRAETVRVLGETATVPPTTVPPAVTTTITTTVTTTITIASPSTVPERLTESSAASSFTELINARRNDEGLAPLQREAGLDELALSWAETVAQNRELEHSDLIYRIVEGPWVAAGENLAAGPDPDRMFAGLVASEPHLENITNPVYSHLGVGVVIVDQRVWTVHLFAG